MVYLRKPSLEDKEKYIDMIREWKEFGGPYVPCIIDYDCNRPLEELDYDAVLTVAENYSNGKLYDYDVEYFESSDFYFIFEDEELIGMGEVRHNLKPLGKQLKGHIVCGIRPSKRRKGYAFHAVELMIQKLKEDNVKEVFLCHYEEDEIGYMIISKLNFKYKDSTASKDNGRKIMCYIKRI